MARDPRSLQAFVLADGLIVDTYVATSSFPIAERFGLQSQIRRAAISVSTNLVEGCSRRSQRDYLHFVDIAMGSASEVRYLFDLAVRLGYISAADGVQLAERYGRVVRALQGVINGLTSPEARSPKPEAPGARP